MVHEATHAQTDLLLSGVTDSLTMEAAGYIAGGAYNHLTGHKVKEGGDQLYVAADSQGAKVASAGASGYVFAPNEIGDLVRAIKGRYPESNKMVNPDGSRTNEVIEPDGKWRVEASGSLGAAVRWTWIYTFNSSGSVRWEDPSNGMNGVGQWHLKRSDSQIHIKWSSGTVDTLMPPRERA